MSGPTGGRGRYVTLIIIIAGVFMSVLDTVALNIALPAITSEFQATVADTQWVVTSYLLAQTCFLIIAGKLSERTGQARMFTVGLIVFTIASFLCALSAGLGQLILFRVVQGIGASMLFSVSTAIVFRAFDVTERGKALGFLGSTIAVAALLGPVIGGFLVGMVGWHFIFLINVPIGAAAAVAALKVMRIEETRVDRLHLDLPGAILWIVSMAFLMIMLGSLGESGAITSAAMVSFAVSAIALALFIRRERRTPFPLIDLSVFRVPRFTLASLSLVMFFISMNMVTIFGPFYYEGVLNYNPATVGLIFMLLPTVILIGSPIIGRMYDRRRFRPYTTAGHIMRAAASFVLAYGFLTVDVPVTLIAFLLMGIGSCLFQTPNNSEIMLSLPREKSGLASSVQATTRNLSTAIGVSLATILMTIMMGSMDYGAIAGGPLAGELARSVAIATAAGGAVSLIGAAISRKSERLTRKEESTS